jgi:hypothetical protein
LWIIISVYQWRFVEGMEILQQALGVVDCGVKERARLQPLAVQVFRYQGTAMTATKQQPC